MSNLISYCFALTVLSCLTINEVAAISCSGQTFRAKATAYYPAPSQGGVVDCMNKNLQTLQQYLAGQVDYVSVAMDQNQHIKFGTQICIPELNARYNKQIEFRVVDFGTAFYGAGFSRIDICVSTLQDAYDPAVNQELTLIFPNLQYGSPSC